MLDIRHGTVMSDDAWDAFVETCPIIARMCKWERRSAGDLLVTLPSHCVFQADYLSGFAAGWNARSEFASITETIKARTTDCG